MQESSPAMEDFDISVAGILKLLKNLKPGKAAGTDRLKPILLKELREEIASIIQVFFERSIKTGKLPSEWCRAQVSPIFKKGDKSSPANYRPISLTCILCKFLEHIMASHLVRHLNKHDLLYDLQHGFREKRACETQLTMLFEDLARTTSSGKQTDFILLDFSKAFDKVNHSKLLWKLHQYGIRGTALSWIRAFLGYRSQTVVLEGEESGSVPVTSGVPQGSVFGLFSSLYTLMTFQKNCHHKCASLLMTRPFTSQLEARTMEQCYKQTLTDCLCGRASGTWSLTPLSAR